jgi:SAM-dependent methyltransferase
VTTPLSHDDLLAVRRSRRHPRPTQFDYLHLRQLVRDLGEALHELVPPQGHVLDVYCGTRPYDDLLPGETTVVGLDVADNPYGLADVVSDEFLPFPDASFDVVLCTQAFDFLPRPQEAVSEFARVLRPGGVAVVTVPLVWEYPGEELVHRYTGRQLATLFDGWVDVRVRQNGGRGVAWATLTGSLLSKLEARLAALPLARRAVAGVFAALYTLVNVVGLGFETLERRHASGEQVLPMNLLLSARRPLE